jgi:hypothetical protein
MEPMLFSDFPLQLSWVPSKDGYKDQLVFTCIDIIFRETGDIKTTNHVSNVVANSSYMLYHAFDVSYILKKNKHGKGPHHKRPETCVWVLKVLVTNMKGLKQVWIPKTKA